MTLITVILGGGMDMFGIKNLFGLGGEDATEKRSDLVDALETAEFSESACSDIVGNAARLRNILRQQGMAISRTEKVRIVKALNKAKVRALMHGTQECYGAFRSLDSISSDVVQLL
jgi:hypothetical protein